MRPITDLFQAVGYKRLAAVEVTPRRSNQHELNGVSIFRRIFGDEKIGCDSRFVYLSDEEDGSVIDTGRLTWYDARANDPKRTEYRLYYSHSEVFDRASEGDLLILAIQKDGVILTIIAPAGSSVEQQLIWLFELEETSGTSAKARSYSASDSPDLDFTRRQILEMLGIEVPPESDNLLDEMIRRFGTDFPSSAIFSDFARKTCPADPVADPDMALLAWLNHEEQLFRTFEEHLFAGVIRRGFPSVDDFITLSLSLHNRRKSRAGRALENHIAAVLGTQKIVFDYNVVTEGRSKPDFLFPGKAAYDDPSFPAAQLRMLGAKSSCKERWRQVLAEAERISKKHLLTLEPAISSHQTDEMERSGLQLVVPQGIHASYTPTQQKWLYSFADFIRLVR